MKSVTWTLETGERRYFVPEPHLTSRQEAELDWFAGCEPCESIQLPEGVTCYHTVRSVRDPRCVLGYCWTDNPEVALSWED